MVTPAADAFARMSSLSISNGLKLETFTGDESHTSWREWKVKFMSRAQLVDTLDAYGDTLRERYEALDGSSGLSQEEVSRQRADLRKRDAIAFAELVCITSGAPNYTVTQFYEKDDVVFKAAAAMQALGEKYEQVSTARKMELKRQYTNARMGTSADPDDFMRDQDFLRQQLKANGHAISDTEFLQDCVLKLPERVYSELITKIEMDLDGMTLASYQAAVRAFYRRKVQGARRRTQQRC